MKFAHIALAALSFAGMLQTASAAMIKSEPLVLVKNGANAASIKMKEDYTSNVLVDFTLSYSGVLANNTFAGLWFGHPDGPNIGLKANCGDKDRPCVVEDVFARTHGQGGSWVAGSNLAARTDYTVVGYLQKVNGSQYYNRFDVWLNPQTTTLTELLKIEHASFTDGSSNVASFSKMGIRTANLKGHTVTFDNINVTAVPEPGSIALFGLALAGMGLVARRKRK